MLVGEKNSQAGVNYYDFLYKSVDFIKIFGVKKKPFIKILTN